MPTPLENAARLAQSMPGPGGKRLAAKYLATVKSGDPADLLTIASYWLSAVEEGNNPWTWEPDDAGRADLAEAAEAVSQCLTSIGTQPGGPNGRHPLQIRALALEARVLALSGSPREALDVCESARVLLQEVPSAGTLTAEHDDLELAVRQIADLLGKRQAAGLRQSCFGELAVERKLVVFWEWLAGTWPVIAVEARINAAEQDRAIAALSDVPPEESQRLWGLVAERFERSASEPGGRPAWCRYRLGGALTALGRYKEARTELGALRHVPEEVWRSQQLGNVTNPASDLASVIASAEINRHLCGLLTPAIDAISQGSGLPDGWWSLFHDLTEEAAWGIGLGAVQSLAAEIETVSGGGWNQPQFGREAWSALAQILATTATRAGAEGHTGEVQADRRYSRNLAAFVRGVGGGLAASAADHPRVATVLERAIVAGWFPREVSVPGGSAPGPPEAEQGLR